MACQRHSQQQLLEVDISEWEAPPAELSVELEHTPQIGDPDRTPDGSELFYVVLHSDQRSGGRAHGSTVPLPQLQSSR